MMHTQQQSRLLQLPAELQLAIFEYAIYEDDALLINCGCDSSYPSIEEWHEDQALWDKGIKRAPLQPSLTRTCATIRSVTLPMFYANAFRAHYCYAADINIALKWLECIGPANRRLLRDFCFWDMNPKFDIWEPNDLKRARRSNVVRGMGGRLETLERNGYCCHQVTYGDADHDHYELVPSLFEG